MVDARLPDGSRVNAIIPPLALDGPVLSIRRFGAVAAADRGPGRHQQRSRPRCWRSWRPAVKREAEHPDLRRHRHRQDDAAERAVVVHPRAASASSRSRTRPSCSCSSRTSSAWRRGRRTSKARARSRGARPGEERAAHAARPHRRRRVPRRRGARHAAGHEHRPRRLDDHGARQHPARRPVARSRRWSAWPACRCPRPCVRQTIARSLQRHHPALARHRRQAPHHQHLGGHRHAGRRHHDAGDLQVRAGSVSTRPARSSVSSASRASGRGRSIASNATASIPRRSSSLTCEVVA